MTRGDEFLGWAEDFPAEGAVDVVSTWVGQQERKKAKGTNRRERLVFPQEFVAEYVPQKKHGDDYLREQRAKTELARVNKELRRLRTQIVTLEEHKSKLMADLGK